jgi:glycerophosphoryl diester phosphodiesterase
MATPVPLPADFLMAPIAHRALHDVAQGRPENSLAAARAAVEAGYGIEVDLQHSADGVPMVFHDSGLKRLTGQPGQVRDSRSETLRSLRLLGTSEPIPTLGELLATVAGRVPILIEVKDQTGKVGPDVGAFEEAIAGVLADYPGPVAVMSFNPHSVAALARLLPAVARGLTVGGRKDSTYFGLPLVRIRDLANMADFDRVGASFVSCDREKLQRPAVAALKARGVPILCWTVRSVAQEAAARRVADNITFEGYPAAIPGA